MSRMTAPTYVGTVCLLAAGMLALQAAASADSGGVPPPIFARKTQDLSNDDQFRPTDRHRFPWFMSASFYSPNATQQDTGYHIGGEVAVGYVFPSNYVDLRLSLRSQLVSTTDQAGDEADSYSGIASMDAFARVKQFYFGPGIGFGTMSTMLSGPRAYPFDETGLGGPSGTVYSFTLGWDLSSRCFIEARAQTSNVDLYDGFMLGFGIRFQD